MLLGSTNHSKRREPAYMCHIRIGGQGTATYNHRVGWSFGATISGTRLAVRSMDRSGRLIVLPRERYQLYIYKFNGGERWVEFAQL